MWQRRALLDAGDDQTIGVQRLDGRLLALAQAPDAQLDLRDSSSKIQFACGSVLWQGSLLVNESIVSTSSGVSSHTLAAPKLHLADVQPPRVSRQLLRGRLCCIAGALARVFEAQRTR